MSTLAPMRLQIHFVNGIDQPGMTTREKELAESKKKAHSARHAYLQLKARKLALTAHKSIENSRQGGQSTQSPLGFVSHHSKLLELASKSSQSPDFTPRSVKHSNLAASGYRLYPLPQNDMSTIYRSESELRAFKLWDAELGLLLGRFASPFEVIYSQVIPRVASGSSTAKNMLLALSFLHQNLHHPHNVHRKDLVDKSRLYYSKGLKAMRQDLPPMELLVSARLACCYESIQENWKATMIHSQGCDTLLKTCLNSKDSDLQMLMKHHQVAHNFYTSASYAVPPGCAARPIASMTEVVSQARRSVAMIAKKLGYRALTSQETMDELEQALNRWMGTLEQCGKADGDDMYSDCLLPLLNLAKALLLTRRKQEDENLETLVNEAEQAFKRAPLLTHGRELLVSLVQLGVLVHDTTESHKGWAFDFVGRVKVAQHSLLLQENSARQKPR